jgi:nucleoside-diphosphate-sugar epimerase
LITGGGGFIGTHMAIKLRKMGNFVRIVDIKRNPYLDGNYYSEACIKDLRLMQNCISVTKDIDYVFNFAANMGGIGYITSSAADIMFDNSLINLNMLKASVKNNVQRFLFSSSACVYPEEKQLKTKLIPLKETDDIPAHPDTPYGWEKLYAEHLCRAFKDDFGLDIRIVRYHNIYGPLGAYIGGREKAPAALCYKISQASDGDTISVWGDGKQTRSFCYIDDCIEGTIRLMSSSYTKPLNIGSDKLITIDGIVDIIQNIAGKRVIKSHDVSKPQGVRGRNADLTLAKKVLNWKPKITLEEGLAVTYHWIDKQRERGF